MKPSSPSSTTVSFAQKIARILASRHARGPDREDFAADIVLEVVVRWPEFDTSRQSAEAFIEVVATSKAAKLVRDARAKKRQPPGVRLPLTEAEVSDRHNNVRDWCLRHDIGAILADLPDDSRQICEEFLRGETVSAIARAKGMPQSTAASKLSRLRPVFDRTDFLDGLA